MIYGSNRLSGLGQQDPCDAISVNVEIAELDDDTLMKTTGVFAKLYSAELAIRGYMAIGVDIIEKQKLETPEESLFLDAAGLNVLGNSDGCDQVLIEIIEGLADRLGASSGRGAFFECLCELKNRGISVDIRSISDPANGEVKYRTYGTIIGGAKKNLILNLTRKTIRQTIFNAQLELLSLNDSIQSQPSVQGLGQARPTSGIRARFAAAVAFFGSKVTQVSAGVTEFTSLIKNSTNWVSTVFEPLRKIAAGEFEIAAEVRAAKAADKNFTKSLGESEKLIKKIYDDIGAGIYTREQVSEISGGIAQIRVSQANMRLVLDEIIRIQKIPATQTAKMPGTGETYLVRQKEAQKALKEFDSQLTKLFQVQDDLLAFTKETYPSSVKPVRWDKIDDFASGLKTGLQKAGVFLSNYPKIGFSIIVVSFVTLMGWIDDAVAIARDFLDLLGKLKDVLGPEIFGFLMTIGATSFALWASGKWMKRQAAGQRGRQPSERRITDRGTSDAFEQAKGSGRTPDVYEVKETGETIIGGKAGDIAPHGRGFKYGEVTKIPGGNIKEQRDRFPELFDKWVSF
jgi:hypothetical protein